MMAKRTLKKTVKAKADKKSRTRKPSNDRKVTRQNALPGMGQVRNKRLDKLCENIGEARERKNQAVTDEEGDSQAALRVMQDGKIDHYTHAGVELIMRRGADKLSIKLLKDKTAEGALAPDAEAPVDGNESGADTGSEAQPGPEPAFV